MEVWGISAHDAEMKQKAHGLAEELELAGITDSIDELIDQQIGPNVDYFHYVHTTASALETLDDSGVLVQVGIRTGWKRDQHLCID